MSRFLPRSLPRSLLPSLPSLLFGALAAWAAIGPAHSATPQAAAASAPLPAASAAAPATAPLNAAALYQQHCASCHGEQRIGLMGPALLPESLERIRPAEVLRVIREGRQAARAVDEFLMGSSELPR